jgi:response regulator NasT
MHPALFDPPFRSFSSMSRVLVLDRDAQRAGVLRQGLTDAGHEVIVPPEPSAYLPDLVRSLAPDVIIIDTDSPDRDTLEHIGIVSAEAPRPIVMFSGDPNSEKIRDAVKAGVSAYVVDGLAAERIQPILDAAVARFAEVQALRNDLAQARAKLEDRKVIDRAKGILMEARDMSEQEAFETLRKLAMDSARPLAEIARQVIGMRDLLCKR